MIPPNNCSLWIGNEQLLILGGGQSTNRELGFPSPRYKFVPQRYKILLPGYQFLLRRYKIPSLRLCTYIIKNNQLLSIRRRCISRPTTEAYGHFIAISFRSGWTNIADLLFVNLYICFSISCGSGLH